MADTARAKNYSFQNMQTEFAGYNSTRDKTNIAPNIMVRGSQNMYKKLSGTISVREGQKRLGDGNSTLSPVSSEFVWNTSSGEIFTMVVADEMLSVVVDNVWYDLMATTQTRYVFDKWWDNALKKDDLLFVNGTDNLYMWSGGFATLASATSSTITKNGTESWQQEFFTPTSFTTIGSATTQFDITNPAGTTFRYTFDGAGTDPLITATSVPVGTYILIQAQNFTAGNNGIFVVTGSGTNYFEVTNASGVVESNKTIGTGFIYTNYTKVLTINGTLYAYTGGETTTTLTGVFPDPSAIPVDTVVLQAVVTYPNTPASGFNADFLKVINNQVYVGSYTSVLIYMSQDTNFANFTVPSPQIAGSPGLFTLDSTAKGIGVRQGNASIGFGSNGWAVISFSLVSNNNIITRVNKIDIKPVAINQAPLAHEFIDNVGDNLIYLAQDHQVRSFGDFNNLFVAGYPSLSQDVATELSQETFTGGGLRCIGEFIYVTAPGSGKTYLRQERTTVDFNGNIVAERLWHSPFIWNITRIDVINNVIVGFSNVNPQIYQLWGTNQWHDDSPSDEPLPYSCVLAFGYRTHKNRADLLSFDKYFSEGYIAEGTPLNLLINYNYDGVTNQAITIVNSTDRPVYTFSSTTTSEQGTGSLGDSPLGDNPLGDVISSDLTLIPKFKNINSLALINNFEYQPVFYSDTADARWEILAVGDNETTSEQQATFLINK